MTTFIRLAAASIACLAMQASFAVTIPAGTTLVVRTLHNISSVDAPGKAVAMQLVKVVFVNGRVALPLGTKISGLIETSKRTRTPTRSLDFIVNISDAQAHARTVAFIIKRAAR